MFLLIMVGAIHGFSQPAEAGHGNDSSWLREEQKSLTEAKISNSWTHSRTDERNKPTSLPSGMLSNISSLEVQQLAEDQPSYSLHFLLHPASHFFSFVPQVRTKGVKFGDKGMLKIFTPLLFWLLAPHTPSLVCQLSFEHNWRHIKVYNLKLHGLHHTEVRYQGMLQVLWGTGSCLFKHAAWHSCRQCSLMTVRFDWIWGDLVLTIRMVTMQLDYSNQPVDCTTKSFEINGLKASTGEAG